MNAGITLITDQNQVIVSLEFAETVVSSNAAQTLGITDPKDLLTLKIEYNISNIITYICFIFVNPKWFATSIN